MLFDALDESPHDLDATKSIGPIT